MSCSMTDDILSVLVSSFFLLGRNYSARTAKASKPPMMSFTRKWKLTVTLGVTHEGNSEVPTILPNFPEVKHHNLYLNVLYTYCRRFCEPSYARFLL